MSEIDKVLRNSGAKLTVTFYIDGVAADADGDVTVTVTDAVVPCVIVAVTDAVAPQSLMAPCAIVAEAPQSLMQWRRSH